MYLVPNVPGRARRCAAGDRVRRSWLIGRELATCHSSAVLDPDLYKVLASDKRLQILEWLRDPEAHFPPQQDGDLVTDGVCSC